MTFYPNSSPVYVPASGVWTTGFDIDISAQTPGTITDGIYTWGGTTVTKINSSGDFAPATIVSPALLGTFNVSASTSVPTTSSQVGILTGNGAGPGSSITFASQPNVWYNVASVNSSTVTLTSAYTGAPNSATPATQGGGLRFAPTGADNNPPTGAYTSHNLSAIEVALTTAYSSIDPSTPLRIWSYISNEPVTPHVGEEFFMAIDDWNGSQYQWSLYGMRGFGGAGNGFYTGVVGTTLGAGTGTTENYPAPPSVFMLWLPLGIGGRQTYIYRYDGWTGNWPSVTSMVPYINYDAGVVDFTTSTRSNYQTMSNIKFLFGVSGDPGFGGDDGFRCTLSRIRVDYHT